ncbi:hypothetical protein D7X55_15290 [Corallococcus sp. AB049A]|uniref:Twin-arginine translocation signal domain-containing protein n=1 Tax=Corallococcus interemptor TaxID=2316720 RepID=A0A3A8QIQ4_9BACT|nr:MULTISPECIES: hypothetical protein [Corallococcus]RKH52233.1 hypothetical protein D7Y23_07540 [Corallococcus sp. AB050B]RKH66205.1 hypothetical protein D7X96_22170 [Corallococcus interemptor]RKI66179.1 hypothetical protein D7X55_15290 [Corallococcus sp. AB049A]
MSGDSNRRHFLKAMGLTAVAAVVPVSLGAASVAGAAPTAATGGTGAMELWLLDTGAGVLDAGLYGTARQDLVASIRARGEALPY